MLLDPWLSILSAKGAAKMLAWGKHVKTLLNTMHLISKKAWRLGPWPCMMSTRLIYIIMLITHVLYNSTIDIIDSLRLDMSSNTCIYKIIKISESSFLRPWEFSINSLIVHACLKKNLCIHIDIFLIENCVTVCYMYRVTYLVFIRKKKPRVYRAVNRLPRHGRWNWTNKSAVTHRSGSFAGVWGYRVSWASCNAGRSLVFSIFGPMYK